MSNCLSLSVVAKPSLQPAWRPRVKPLTAWLIIGMTVLVGAGAAQAATFTGTLDTSSSFSPSNFSSDGVTYFNAPSSAPFSPVAVGEFDFSIPSGQAVSAVTISGNFGSNILGSGSAPVSLFLNGVAVATCNAVCSTQTDVSDVAWTYTFAPADYSALATGKAILTAVQTAPSQIVLDPTTMSIQTSPVPEPASGALLLVGLASVRALSRRRHGASQN